MPEQVKLFYSYAKEDESLLDQLAVHLSPLERQGVIKTWHHRNISAGAEWAKEINDNINSAQIILLLVSADFLASDYCYGVEMKRAIARHQAGEACVIPVILRPVDLKDTPFSQLQPLPKDGKPITKWQDRDEALMEIAQGIRHVAQQIRDRKGKAEIPPAFGFSGEEAIARPYSSLAPIMRDLRLDYLQNQLHSLTEELTVIQERLDVELDSVNETKLKRRAEVILQKIEACEQEIRDRQTHLTQQSTHLATSTLIQILQTHPSHLGLMQNAFQSLLNRRSYPPSPPLQMAEAMVNALLRFPKGSFACRALDEFVASLVIAVEDTALLAALQSWGEQQVPKWADLLHQLKQTQEVQDVKPVLMVSLRRSDEHSTQTQDGPYYQIRAVFIRDQHHYRTAQQGYSPVQRPGTTGDEAYRKDELSQEISRLLAHSLAEANTSTQEPEIHVFLPIELMNDAIDQWCPQAEYGRPQPIGGKYNVVLRCAERLSRSYIHRREWHSRWQQQQSLCEAIALQTFAPGNDADLDELYDALEALEDDIVGLKVTQVPENLNPDGLFGAILQAGLPLAIWSRCELAELAIEAELDRLLGVCCLTQLPHTVRDERRAARKVKNKDCHIGHHLSLLWDDPDLIPPKSA